jgi:hypothetical protein
MQQSHNLMTRSIECFNALFLIKLVVAKEKIRGKNVLTV